MSQKHKYTNHLIGETSPYLIQHAHNPVNWFPWGEEAFSKARLENKPIFLSVGYAACHWCHVMEHESFNDEETANLLNENFISIKVDREERPDIDNLYMNAVQMMTGHGGWPMSVFMDADGQPFYGGTYFPPVDRYNLPSFKRLILTLSNLWATKRQDLTQTSKEIKSALGSDINLEKSDRYGYPDYFHSITRSILNHFDSVHGGFGKAPKFPPSMTLQYLMAHYHTDQNSTTKFAIEVTLNGMANGGLYDQIGGGFSRYSVDDEWHVPHFEKMLYDNALLSLTYMQASNLLGNNYYGQIAKETLVFVDRELSDPAGGFYSSLDADSEGEEGKFYTWSHEQVLAILPVDLQKLALRYFDIKENGNWESVNVLRKRFDDQTVAREFNLSLDELDQKIHDIRSRLLKERDKRIRPLTDDKVLTSWNGLMILSFLYSGFHLKDERFVDRGLRGLEFLLDHQFNNGIVYRVFKKNETRIPGFLDDYSHLLLAVLFACEYAGKWHLLDIATQLADLIIKNFYDEDTCSFWMSGNSNDQLMVRQKDLFDNAIPSGISSTVLGFEKLSTFTGIEKYSKLANGVMASASGTIAKYPSSFGWMLLSLFRANISKTELVFANVNSINSPWLSVIQGKWDGDKLIAYGQWNQDLPIFKGKIDTKSQLYVCKNFACEAPVETLKELETLKLDG